jgi:hypothetical protein
MTAREQAEAAAWEIDTDPSFAFTRSALHLHDLNLANSAVTGNFEVPATPGTPQMDAETANRLALSRRGLEWLNSPPAAPAPQLPAASGPPAVLPSQQQGQAGGAGANGKVEMNVRITGQPAVVTSRTTGGVDLNVATSGLPPVMP